jgi:hypothetical protein
MDDMRSRYRQPQQDNSPAHIPEALRHAYQPPPAHQAKPESPPQPAAPPPPAYQHPTIQREALLEDSRDSHHQARPKPPAGKTKRRRGRKILAGVIVLAIIAGGGIFAYPRLVQADPFSADIQTNAGYPLFYPAKLPPGYAIDKTDINLANGVVIYSAINGDKRLVFTMQKTPPGFDFDNFYKQQLSNNQQFQTPYGQAVVGKNSGRFLGSLSSGGSWLLVSTNSQAVSMDDISLVMTHLKKY